MTHPKNQFHEPDARRRPSCRSLILAIACAGIVPLAHAAADPVDISDTLVKTCNNGYDGKSYGDQSLDEVRGTAFPSPKTGGFTIASVNPTLQWPLSNSYCLVKGTILPTSADGIDPAVKSKAGKVPEINFQVYVPTRWNGKLIQLGGGAFAWSADVLASKAQFDLMFAKISQDTWALDGYALVMSDAGNVDPDHPSQPNPAGGPFGTSFVKDANSIGDIARQELVKDFGRDSIKKSLDVGLRVVKELTGKTPSEKYFVGYSTGGRQALMAVANWPDAYDGAVSGAPSVYLSRMIKGVAARLQGNYDGENWIRTLTAIPNMFFGGTEWSDPAVSKAFSTLVAGTAESLKKTAINSGANNDPLNTLMDALGPVWDVNPGDIKRFLEMPADATGKKKKLILFQGAADIVVPCTQTARFIRDTADLFPKTENSADIGRTSARAFFIKDYNHVIYNGNAKGAALLFLDWNPVSALDRWIRDDSAQIGAPRKALDPVGNVPSEADLNSWGCAPGDFK